jgi:hypothetical protein
MSLYLSHWEAIDPYPLWEKLGLPSFAIMDRRTMRIEKSEFQIV